MAPFYGCRDPGTKLDGVKLAPVTAKTSKTGRAAQGEGRHPDEDATRAREDGPADVGT